jgi:hypothetical protein
MLQSQCALSECFWLFGDSAILTKQQRSMITLLPANSGDAINVQRGRLAADSQGTWTINGHLGNLQSLVHEGNFSDLYDR